MTLSLVSLALVVGSALAAPSGDDACTFLDAIADEVRTCDEGPAERSWTYLEEDDHGELRVAEGYAEKLADHLDLSGYAIEDGGDVEEEVQSADSAYLRKLRDFLFFLIQLAVAAGEPWQEYAAEVGLSGPYDGVLANHSSSTTAYLDVAHSGSDVAAQLFVLDPTLVLDAGVCGTVQLPVGVLDVTATSSGPFEASGTARREVRVGQATAVAELHFDLALEQQDFEQLEADISIDLPWPCADQELTGFFTRRNGALF